MLSVLVRGLLASAVFLIVCADASAARRVATAGTGLDAGPILVGSELAWKQSSCRRSCGRFGGRADLDRFVVKLTEGGNVPSVIRRGIVESDNGDSAYSYDVTSLKGSAQALALQRYRESGYGGLEEGSSASLLAGLPPALDRTFYGCSYNGAGAPPFSIDGSELSYQQQCAPRRQLRVPGPLTITDLMSGASEEVELAEGTIVISVAGADRYLAYLARPAEDDRFDRAVPNATLVVYDRERRRVAYSLEISDWGLDDVVDVASDGTVALMRASGGRGCGAYGLSWTSLAEPREHAVAARPCTAALAIAGGEILFLDDPTAKNRLQTDPSPGSRLRAVALEGDVRDIVPHGAELGPDFDIDGTRVSYGVRNCRGGYDLMVARASLRQPPVRRVECPVRLRSRRLVVAEGGQRVAIRVACPRGCYGAVGLRRGGRPFGRRRFTLPAGASRLPLALDLRIRGVLGGRGVPARVAIRTVDRYGDSHRTSARVALVRSSAPPAAGRRSH